MRARYVCVQVILMLEQAIAYIDVPSYTYIHYYIDGMERVQHECQTQ